MMLSSKYRDQYNKIKDSKPEKRKEEGRQKSMKITINMTVVFSN